MSLKRMAAVPLLIVGALGLLAGFLLAIGITLYYNWQFFKLLLDGNFMTALVAIPIISMLGMAACSLLMLPFNGLIALAGWLWEHDERALAEGSREP